MTGGPLGPLVVGVGLGGGFFPVSFGASAPALALAESLDGLPGLDMIQKVQNSKKFLQKSGKIYEPVGSTRNSVIQCQSFRSNYCCISRSNYLNEIS